MREQKKPNFKPFHYKKLSQIKNTIDKLDLNLPISTDLSVLKSSKKFLNTFVPNRLGIQPMEGFDAKKNGSPSELTRRRYKRYAKGGAGLIWVEATAFMAQGRSNAHQLIINEQNLKKFSELAEDTRELCNQTLKSLGFDHKCLLILQLNHSGRYCKKGDKPYPIKAFDYEPLEKGKKYLGKIISDRELRIIEEKWIKGILLAEKAGFDGVDIKSCHGYLINELLSAHIREDSEYGGKSLHNRAKLLLNITSKSMDELNDHPNFIFTTRMSVYNGISFPYGFGVVKERSDLFPAPIDLDEPKKLISMLYERGVRLINITAGNPHHKPFITRPYDTPIEGGEVPAEHPLFSLQRIYSLTGSIKSVLPPDMVIVGSALSYLRQYGGYIAAGLISENIMDICGFGRMAFANPQFPTQLFQDGIIDKKQTCIACSSCSDLMRKGKNTGCVIRDPAYKHKSS